MSPNTFVSRHALTILWSREQDVNYELDIPGAECEVQSRKKITFTAKTATVTIQQSENFISTVAHFSICAASPKEEKTFLRFSAAFRDLYREFVQYQRERSEAADRETVKKLRAVLQDQPEPEDLAAAPDRGQATRPNPGVARRFGGAARPTSEVCKELWKKKQSTFAYRKMLSVRNALPISAFRKDILAALNNHQIVIICGETGCGKSTQVPSFVLENELAMGHACKIYCTEPRRISAISLAQRVSEELGEGRNELGTGRSMVGYAIRLESRVSDQTKLVYATVGVVLRMLESAGKLDTITHLVIDEVHERKFVKPPPLFLTRC